MKLTTIVDGIERKLELSTARTVGSAVSFALDSEAGQADIVSTGESAYSIVHDGLSYEVSVHDGGDGVFQVQVNGIAHEVEVRDARRWMRGGGASAVAGPRKIKAPMPGRIVKLLVQVGDQVEAGQGVIIVEAMKMQNEMKAPKAGKVGTVEAAAGDSVAAGQTLLSIE